MKFIDMHCDTLMPYAKQPDFSLYSNNGQVDFLKMQKGGALAQFFAMFFVPPDNYEKEKIPFMTDMEYFNKLSTGFYSQLEKHKDIIAFAGDLQDIINNEKQNKMSAVLTIEDGRMINGDLDMLKFVYDKGVRAISLTWNFANCFGYPNTKDENKMALGLTDFGKQAITVMNDLGILVDVSHLSDGGFYDVAKISKKPFVATHSNARSLSPHTRNLTDDMIKILGNTGSVTGLNFAPGFIDPNTTANHTPIEGIVKHAKYLANLGGIDCVGMGTDFDGIYGTQEIADCSMLPLLWDAFAKAGFHESEIEKITYKNVLRVIGESMK